MDDLISPTERSRRAPLHFWAKADNARMAARYLWDATEKSMEISATEIGYESSSNLAAFESFRRESSLALELIIKAVIARRIEQGSAMVHVKKVRAIHDLEKLWTDAQLPKLERAERLHLLQASQALYWSGRYAAPLTDEALEKDLEALEELLEVTVLGSMKLRSSQPMAWERFDRIYGIAFNEFCRLREEWEHGPRIT